MCIADTESSIARIRTFTRYQLNDELAGDIWSKMASIVHKSFALAEWFTVIRHICVDYLFSIYAIIIRSKNTSVVNCVCACYDQACSKLFSVHYFSLYLNYT